MNEAAFILRISHGEDDLMLEALSANQIIIGWANAAGLLDPNLNWGDFREIVSDAYYSDHETYHSAGNAGGHLWKFIRDMKPGDLVVVPSAYGSEFFVAEVTGDATYNPTKIEDDSAYRRAVRWLNEGKSIPRTLARSALISRMKTQGTTAHASDLLDEIKECLRLADKGEVPTFQTDLQSRLVREALAELRDGRIESYGFERLIKTVLEGLGAVEVRMIARNQDMGADLIAKFRIAGAFLLSIAVQAKHWQPEPPVGRAVVEQLICGIEGESADLGMVITSGAIAADAVEAAEQYYKDKGIRIELVDGEQFAKLIVEHGIHTR